MRNPSSQDTKVLESSKNELTSLQWGRHSPAENQHLGILIIGMSTVIARSPPRVGLRTWSRDRRSESERMGQRESTRRPSQPSLSHWRNSQTIQLWKHTFSAAQPGGSGWVDSGRSNRSQVHFGLLGVFWPKDQTVISHSWGWGVATCTFFLLELTQHQSPGALIHLHVPGRCPDRYIA